jgi:ribosomal protein S30
VVAAEMTSVTVRGITIKGGKVQTKPPRMPAGQRKNQEAKARRLEKAWKAKSKS